MTNGIELRICINILCASRALVKRLVALINNLEWIRYGVNNHK